MRTWSNETNIECFKNIYIIWMIYLINIYQSNQFIATCSVLIEMWEKRLVTELWLLCTSSRYTTLTFSLHFQRNHSLFGTVISALQGNRATPSPNRSNSLQINYTQPHRKLSPTNSLNAPAQLAHNKLSPQNSLNNGKVSPANSYLGVDYRNAINRSPSPISPMNSLHLSPVTSTDNSRRPRYVWLPFYWCIIFNFKIYSTHCQKLQ